MAALLPSVIRQTTIVVLSVLWLVFLRAVAFAQSDPLPSWNDGAAKKSITDFVAKVTTQGSADFVLSTDDTNRRLIESHALEAAIWGLSAANTDLMR